MPLDLMQVYQSFRGGQEAARKNRLLDLDEQGRALQGQVLAGDASKLPELMRVDPQRGIQAKQYTDAEKKRIVSDFAREAYGARTPEAYSALVQRWEAQGHKFDDWERDPANRDAVISRALDIGDSLGLDLRREQMAGEQSYRQQSLAQDQRQHDETISLKRDEIAASNRPKVPLGYRDNGDGTMSFIEGGPHDPAVVAAKKGGMKPSASMLKLQRETENNVVDLKNTIAVLGRARELAPKTFEGVGAGLRAAIGTKAPFLPAAGIYANPEHALATTEYGNIMSMEAIQSMSNSLKGATTDFELRKFENILSDPSVPASIKMATIDRMMKLANSKLALEEQRLEEFGSEVPGGETDLGNQGVIDPDEALRQASEAIAAGADPAAVQQRLREQDIEADFVE